MVRIVDICICPTQQRILGQVRRLGGKVVRLLVGGQEVRQLGQAVRRLGSQVRRLGGQVVRLGSQEVRQLSQEVRRLGQVVRLGCQSRLGARECATARSRANLGQWHIVLSHNISIYGRYHITNVRQGESQDRSARRCSLQHPQPSAYIN